MTYNTIQISKSVNTSGSHAYPRMTFNAARQLLAELAVTLAPAGSSATLNVVCLQSYDGGVTYDTTNPLLQYTQIAGGVEAVEVLDDGGVPFSGDLKFVWTLAGGSAHGTLNIDPAGSNNKTTWTGKATLPVDDNDVTVTYVDPGVAAALTVVVTGHDIVVNLARAAAVKATLTTAMTGANNDITLNALVGGVAGNSIAVVLSNGAAHAATTASVTGTTATVLLRSAITRAAFTTLCANANSNITYSAVANGAAGNSVHIVYVVGGTNTPLSIGVVGSVITVNVATNGGGTATSTATLVKAAIEASAPAHALVTAALTGTGAGVVAAFADAPLVGGDDKSIVASAQEVCNALNQNNDFKLLATAEPKSGDSGAGIVTALGSTPLSGGLASAISTTAGQIITAVAANTAANALVVVTNFAANDGTGLVTAMSTATLDNAVGVTSFTINGFGK